MDRSDLKQMFRVFGRIGLLSFGGPAAQIALMHNELVEKRAWLDEQTFLRALSLCMLLPGPEAMQLATYAGWKLRGVAGGLLAGLLFILPGAVVISCLALLYVQYGQMPVVQAAFDGIKATVIVIVFLALRKLAERALTETTSWVIAGLSFLSIFVFDVPFPIIIAISGIWGAWSATQPVIKEKSPAVKHPHLFRTTVTWLLLWLVPLLVISLVDQSLLGDIGWLFARLAVVTFGGAYAVLAYLTQIMVEDYQWISTAQMIDALGLAETTPGPLILVTQFVAMLAGKASGGVGLSLIAGFVALWATFVPCFLWIFVTAPYVERISERPRLAGALRSITAAVVGVILNLTLWFTIHVFFEHVEQYKFGLLNLPLPSFDTLNAKALLFTAVAALFLRRLDMMYVIILMAAGGAGALLLF